MNKQVILLSLLLVLLFVRFFSVDAVDSLQEKASTRQTQLVSIDKTEHMLARKSEWEQFLNEASSIEKEKVGLFGVFEQHSSFELATQRKIEDLLEQQSLKMRRFFWLGEVSDSGLLKSKRANINFSGNTLDVIKFHENILSLSPAIKVQSMVLNSQGGYRNNLKNVNAVMVIDASYLPDGRL
jgi:hypothetical protein